MQHRLLGSFIRRTAILLGATLLVASRSAYAQCADWDARFHVPGMSGNSVSAMTVFDDGTGPALYVGGAFDSAGDTSANGIAKWNGTTWAFVGSGRATGAAIGVYALCVFDEGNGPALFAGGFFTSIDGVPANYVARWDGTTWSALGDGTNAAIRALAVFDDGTGPALYAGGQFTSAGGVSASHVAKWDGATWSTLGDGVSPFFVNALAVFDPGSGPRLYAAGSFTTAGGIPAKYIASWDGASWSPLGSGLDDWANALVVHDDGSGAALYVGGNFHTLGGVSSNAVARWNGSAWTRVGGFGSDAVFSLAVFDDGAGQALFAGGLFTSIGGKIANRVARWDGLDWLPLNVGVNQATRALGTFDDGSGSRLYVGGQFTRAGGALVNRIASWDGASWSRVGPAGHGASGPVHALLAHDDPSATLLYAGGDFDAIGGSESDDVSAWDGTQWHTLGAGFGVWSSFPPPPVPIPAVVHALAEFDDGTGLAIYAGGTFQSADGAWANRVARWNGSSWTPLGAGLGSPSTWAEDAVHAFCIFDDGGGPALFAAGRLDDGSRIRKWSGTSWIQIGGGPSNTIYALAVFDDGSGPALYAGGQFATVGGVPANNVARWDGSTWSTLGTGMNDFVRALCVFDDGTGPALYAGGNFDLAGGARATRVAKWNGTSWSELGSGVDDAVYALATLSDASGDALYVGGYFVHAGGIDANRVARWDGSTWSSLVSGADASVLALAAWDDGADGAPDLYAGGSFTRAGGKLSFRIGRWSGCEPGAAYCFGDGLDPVQTVECPCGNIGEPGHGCTAFPPSLGGARLLASGTLDPNTVVLRCEDVANNTLCTFLRSFNNNAVGLVFGDGVRCVNPPLFRFGQQMSGQSGNDPFTVAVPAPTEIPGNTLRYVLQYRNPNAGWCPPALFNASNGYTIQW